MMFEVGGVFRMLVVVGTGSEVGSRGRSSMIYFLVYLS